MYTRTPAKRPVSKQWVNDHARALLGSNHPKTAELRANPGIVATSDADTFTHFRSTEARMTR